MNLAKVLIIVLGATIGVITSVSDTNNYSNSFKNTQSVVQQVELKPLKKIAARKPVIRGGLKSFLKTMAKVESDNTPTAQNRYGMLGKYQFSPKTIKAMGYSVSKEEFLQNETLQDEIMLKYMRDNRRSLRPIIKQYSGTYVNDVFVTEAGILAGAHLGGTGGLLSFFYPEKYKYKTSDANGTSIAFYMKKFANYDLSSL